MPSSSCWPCCVRCQRGMPARRRRALVEQLGSARYRRSRSGGRGTRANRPARSGGPCATLAIRATPRCEPGPAALAQKIENALLTQPTRRSARLPKHATPRGRQISQPPDRFPDRALSDQSAEMAAATGQPARVGVGRFLEGHRPALRSRRPAVQCEHARLYRQRRADLCLDRRNEPHPDADFGPRSVPCQLDRRRVSEAVSPMPRAGSGLMFRRHPRPAVLEPEHRDEASSPPRLNPVTSVQFSAQLLVAAEPRLALSQVRPLELVEAVDDRGNSLIPVGDDETGHRSICRLFRHGDQPRRSTSGSVTPARRRLANGSRNCADSSA